MKRYVILTRSGGYVIGVGLLPFPYNFSLQVNLCVQHNIDLPIRCNTTTEPLLLITFFSVILSSSITLIPLAIAVR